MNLSIQLASLDQTSLLGELIELSARTLGRADYSEAQIEAALRGAWGVDTQLIRDRTYFVVFEGSSLVACGGWSKRKALFGADSLTQTEAEQLDPKLDPARIRAFFVHPQWGRRGLGRMLLERCEIEARAARFRSAELVATLPGERLYAACGYISQERFEYSLGEGVTISFVRMRKPKL